MEKSYGTYYWDGNKIETSTAIFVISIAVLSCVGVAAK